MWPQSFQFGLLTVRCAMGASELFLSVFVVHFISVIGEDDSRRLHQFSGLFRDVELFPFENNFDFTPSDTMFSSWRNWAPDIHMLSDLPPIMSSPRIQLFCNESHLSVLVDKRFSGVVLTKEEVHLGDGCTNNRERPNQFVFTYSVVECGTEATVQNGIMGFSNTIYLSPKKALPSTLQTQSTIQISCFPKRSYVRVPPPGIDKSFSIKAMNPSWTNVTQSNVYKRGKVVNLQVSAGAGPGRQLFVQSCFVSASPQPQTRPRHALIMNKGCTIPLGSPQPPVQFVASGRGDVVNFVLNTKYLISKFYVHCSMLISDQSLTSGSKSCNYNLFQSRWEDLNGDVEVCECCSTRCKVPSVKHLTEDTKATIKTGPFIIVDEDTELMKPEVSEPQQPLPTFVPEPRMSNAAVMKDKIVSGVSVFPLPQVVVSRDPAVSLANLMPSELIDAVSSKPEYASNDLPQPSMSHLNPLSNHIDHPNKLNSDVRLWDLNRLPWLDGWAIAPQPEKTEFQRRKVSDTKNGGVPLWDLSSLPILDGWAITPKPNKAEFSRRKRVERSEVPQVDILLPTVDIDLTKMRDQLAPLQEDLAIVSQDEMNAVSPVVRSKLQYSKGVDGMQTLSYEEEVVKRQNHNGATRGCMKNGVEADQEHRQKGLRSAFLEFLRKMDKAE